MKNFNSPPSGGKDIQYMLHSAMIDGHAGLHLTYLVMPWTAVRLFTFREMTGRQKLYQLLISAQTVSVQFSLFYVLC